MRDPRRDVVVIGAGPAGSVAALLLARRGWDVTLVEQHRFPRDKVCGECLSALGMEVLDRHGLGGRVRDAGAVPLTSSAVHSAGGRSLRLTLPRPMWGLSRQVFDGLLLDAAREAGVAVRQPARCEGVDSSSSRVSVRLRDLGSNKVETLHPARVIVADGKATLCGRAPPATGDFGIKTHFENLSGPPGRIELFGTCGTYGGLAPVEGGRWNAAFSVPAAALRRCGGDIDSLFERLAAANPVLRDRLRGARRVSPWAASPLPRFAVTRDWPRNVVPVGNAAAALEPIGGEGMGLAVQSAELAAEALADAAEAGRQHDAGALARRYGSLWRCRSAACRAAAKVVSRPATAAAAFSLARVSPPLTRLAMRLVGKAGEEMIERPTPVVYDDPPAEEGAASAALRCHTSGGPMLRRTRPFLVLVAATAALSSVASGAAVFSTDVQFSPDPANSWTPTYVVSTSDLINGRMPASSAGNFALEVGGGLPVLTDGAYGTITRRPVAPVAEPHPAFATAGNLNGSGQFATYNLDLAASPLGYNISRIDVYGGWNDAGRDQQRYEVAYSTVANPTTFIPLTSVDYQPANPTNVQSATLVRITDNALPNLATGVAAVLFDFSPPVENGHTGYAEIDIIGTPVPEPTTAGLLGLACLGLLARRRRG